MTLHLPELAGLDRSLYPRLAARLPFGIVGREFYPLRSAHSTQDVAKELGAAGAPEGAVVVADYQTRGRGRAGRTWLAEPGANLLFSVLLRPPLPISRAPQLSLLAAVAAAEALAETRAPVRIRWPNDLMLAGKKVGGVLTETTSGTEGLLYVVVGIGINVNQTGFPEKIRERATSLALAAGRSLDREQVLETLLTALNRWYAVYLEAGFETVRSAWRRSSATLGEWVVGGQGLSGTALDLDEDGALLVRVPSGIVRRVVAGEIQ